MADTPDVELNRMSAKVRLFTAFYGDEDVPKWCREVVASIEAEAVANHSAALRAAVEGLPELLAKATPGPWVAHSDGLVWRTDDAPGDPVSGSTEYADAALIVAAVNALPHLLALLDHPERLTPLAKTAVPRSET